MLQLPKQITELALQLRSEKFLAHCSCMPFGTRLSLIFSEQRVLSADNIEAHFAMPIPPFLRS